MKINKGMSLIEILVVVTIFAVLGIVVTRAVLSTISGSKKSESLIRVRENLSYSLGIIERQLRNADSITQCPNSDPLRIDYHDQFGNSSYFACLNEYVASGSARLTSTDINVTSCSFVCTLSTGSPSSVTITLSAKDKNGIGAQGATVDVSSEIYLRNY